VKKYLAKHNPKQYNAGSDSQIPIENHFCAIDWIGDLSRSRASKLGLVSRIVGGKGLFALSTLIAANNRYGITGPLTSP
jgi:hypothetical protein